MLAKWMGYVSVFAVAGVALAEKDRPQRTKRSQRPQTLEIQKRRKSGERRIFAFFLAGLDRL